MPIGPLMSIGSEIELDATKVQLLKTEVEEYQVTNPNYHMPSDPKTIPCWRVRVTVFLENGCVDMTTVDFGEESDAASEWCDIIKDDWRRHYNGH